MVQYWCNFQSLRAKSHRAQPLDPNPGSVQEEQAPHELEVDNPTGSLKLFITMVENLLGEDRVGEGFAEVKTLLLKVIETPTATVNV